MGIIAEAHVLAEVSPVLVDGVSAEDEAFGVVWAALVLHVDLSAATEETVEPSEI